MNNQDHGYQITAGKLILFGEMPYKDFFWGYGPLVAYTSALSQLLSPSLIGEVTICSLGYALSIFFIYYLVSKHTTKTIGIIASIIGFLLLARFYKWWYWLFPLLVLYCIFKLIGEKSPNSSKWFCISGIICGFGTLYRYDLGIAFIIIFLLYLVISAYHKKISVKDFVKDCLLFLTFYSFFLLALVFYILIIGWTLMDFILIISDGVIGNNQYWSLPVPSINYNDILSYQSIIAIIYRIIPISLFSGILYGFFGPKFFKSDSSKYPFLLFSSIMGLLIFPQALNRADYGHLLLVIPPVIIVVCILLFDIWMKVYFIRNSYKKIGIIVSVFLYILIILIFGWVINQHGYLGGQDLDKVDIINMEKLTQIYVGKINIIEENQYVSLINSAKNYTSKNDTILIIPPIHQLYYFIDRPMSGMTIWYGPGCYDQIKWRDLNFERILHNPPKIVIINNNFSDGFTNYLFNEYQPNLYNYIINEYNSTLLRTQDYSILVSSD